MVGDRKNKSTRQKGIGGNSMGKVMKKVLIVGAGGQGGPCASILARDKDISEIVLGDIDLDLANKVKDRIKSDKITTVKVDAGKVESVESAAKGADAIINLTLMQFNANIMKAALNSGAQYVDAALDYPAMERLTENKPLEMDDEFKKAGLTALVACGSTPGVSNVLVKYVCDKLDQVDAIRIRCGKIQEQPKDIISAWDPGWSPKTAILDWAHEPIVFEDGEYKKCPPFSGREEYNFEPFGKVLLGHHEHEEAAMLPRFIGKGVKYVDFKYTFDIQAGNLIQLGLASEEPIDVKGVKVSPLDVLTKLVRSPVNDFFTEEEIIKRPVDAIRVMAIKVRGVKSGEDIEYTISYHFDLLATMEERLEGYRKFGTMNIQVALPAIVGAKMCVEDDAGRGVIGPECLDPIKFLKRMTDMGCPVKFHETLSKKISIL
jgi:saccharopine dehydrogenase-like NADP-dependent oxidoreductase